MSQARLSRFAPCGGVQNPLPRGLDPGGHAGQFSAWQGARQVAPRRERQALACEGPRRIANLDLQFVEQHQDTRSIAIAVASPPPMHSEATPRLRP
jgi:hypothetical protein